MKLWFQIVLPMMMVLLLTACSNDSTAETIPEEQSPPIEITEETADMPETSQTTQEEAVDSPQTEMRVLATFAGGEAEILLADNATSRSFWQQLPLTLTFEDFAGEEKIAYPPAALSQEGAATGYDPAVGDITCYGPWGNIAIFYEDHSYSEGLIPMGTVVSGLADLSAMTEDFTVTLTQINETT